MDTLTCPTAIFSLSKPSSQISRVYIALAYIKPHISMHSVPVAVCRAEKEPQALRDGGGDGPRSSPLVFIPVDPPPHPNPPPRGTQTLYVLIRVGNKDFLLS